jgi:phage terminase small subunit
MAETDADPIASWNERVGTLRKRGRISTAALSVVPQDEVDVRRGRPAAPDRLSTPERDLWERLIFSRRPGWFAGAEELLESYCTTVTQLQQIETALRKTKAGTSERYMKLARMHRQVVMLTATLATRLRLSPSTRLDRRTPQDGDLPVG